jgi:putative transposase
MKKLKAYKYRLKPNTEQIRQINQHFGAVRFVKNWAIALRSRYYKLFGKSISSRCLQDKLVKKKSLPKWTWLNEVNSQSLLAALKEVDTGHTEDRDLHVAINIKRFGLQQFSEQVGTTCGVKCSS